MKSIFDIPEKKEDLSSSNDGMANLHYEQVQPLKNIAGASFPNGEIPYRWRGNPGSYWIPNRSYFVIRLSLTRSDGSSLQVIDNIAPNMACASCLIEKCSYKLNTKTICSLSENIAEVDMLKKRMLKSREWLNTIGSNIGFYQESLNNRINQVSSDGVSVKETTNLNLLSFLDLEGGNTYSFGGGDTILLLAIGLGNAIPNLTTSVHPLRVGDDLRVLIGVVFESRKITAFGVATITLSGANIALQAASVIERNVLKEGLQLSLEDNTARKNQSFELVYQPPLAVFDLEHAIPNIGLQEINIKPFINPTYSKQFVESLVDKVPGLGNDYLLEIKEMYLYLCTVDGPIIDHKNIILDLNEITCQKREILTNSQIQTTTTVLPSTNGIAVSWQDSTAGTLSNRPLSRFRIGSVDEHKEQSLTRFNIHYAGNQYPQPDLDPLILENTGLVNTGVDYLLQQYTKNIIYSNQMYNNASETYEEFKKRGIYIYTPFKKTASDTSTQCRILTQFSDAFVNQRMLIFNFYKRVAIIQIENGRAIKIVIDEV